MVRPRGTMTGGPDLQLQLLDVRWGTGARDCGAGRAGPEDRRTVPEAAAEVADRVAALAFAGVLFPDRVSPVTAPVAVLGMLAAAVGLSAGALAMTATDVRLERRAAPRIRSLRRLRAQDEEALQLMLQGAVRNVRPQWQRDGIADPGQLAHRSPKGAASAEAAKLAEPLTAPGMH